MLSIIIPTLNEEKYLPKLLESIRKQDFSDYEIIVADADSQDRTKEIAKKYSCRIVLGGSPAQGKNNGAESSCGDLLFFIDADCFLPDNFFKKCLYEFKKRKLKIAGFLLIVRNRKFISFLFNIFYNFPICVMNGFFPHGAMGILIEKKLFRDVNGFDKTIKLAEDHDLVRKAAKKAKFGIIKSSRIFVSDRRFRKDGWIRTYFKYVLCELYITFIGPVKSDIFNYKFGHYSKNKKDGV